MSEPARFAHSMLNTARCSARLLLALHPPMDFHKYMNNYSPARWVKEIDGQISRILRQTDSQQINDKGRKAIGELQQNLVDAKVYTQDYELSETREEQMDNAEKAKKYLRKSRQAILRASEFDVFSPIDVAHLTAQIDQLKAELK